MLSDKRFVCLHHSATKDSGTVSWDAIRKYHVETNGWRAIGYHFGVELIGGRYEILKGRMLHESAAAVKEGGLNTTGIHICVVGDFDKDAPPPDQYRLTLRLVREILDVFKLPTSAVRFHREFAVNRSDGTPYKSCPGWAFPSLDQVRFDVAKL